MKAVIQRVNQASVRVDDEIVGSIERGLLVLLGVTHEDTEKDADYLFQKIINLRIFEDDEMKMNLSLKDIGGSLLSVSQFTLYGDCRKGRRPNFMEAAQPDHAKALYDYFNEKAKAEVHTETGTFGAMMDISMVNSGPVTLLLDSTSKK
ncbi:D-aminoacyl-tRNA deacylase [Paraliobacillus quinghaiensis]|uniref:D-aminoacyl-tRNA deacylase n=1 Tax=Paraliobacillus quinghaiensis TaxID=470815 RepID=A0A917WTJ0_9BACI|nr:D-aminoacyl-tRNA deacylase [Paraliobacillus quinghaiensis]GGM30829.1 D-aminoacyl-tRNA deacylase [Paraliobacillus quinghaiensis]